MRSNNCRDACRFNVGEKRLDACLVLSDAWRGIVLAPSDSGTTAMLNMVLLGSQIGWLGGMVRSWASCRIDFCAYFVIVELCAIDLDICCFARLSKVWRSWS